MTDVRTQPNNTLTNIFSGYQESLRNRQKMTDEYNEFMQFAQEQVEGITDAESANEIVEWAKTCRTHIWDSKLQISRLIKEKATELSLSFDRSAGQCMEQKKVKGKPSIKETANARD